MLGQEEQNKPGEAWKGRGAKKKWGPLDGPILCFCRPGGTSSAHAAPGEAIPCQEQRRGELLSALMGNSFLLLSSSHKKLWKLHVPKSCSSAHWPFHHQGNRILELPPSCLSAWINKINIWTRGGWGGERRGAAAGEQPCSLQGLMISVCCSPAAPHAIPATSQHPVTSS